MKISGIEIKEKKFAYDGCHKIYLIGNSKSEKEARSYGYEIYPVADGKNLIEAFVYSCSLRFIDVWNDKFESIIPQFEKCIVFDGFKIPHDIEPPMGYTVNIKDNILEMKMIME